MNTEDDLRAGLLAEGIGGTDGDTLLIGLADDALAQAARQTRTRRLGAAGLAALAAAGVSASVLAGSPEAGPHPVAPASPTSTAASRPLSGPQALLEVGVVCPPGASPGGLSPTSTLAWDPATGKYQALLDPAEQPTLLPSPDGSRALVTTQDPASTFLSWAVAGWADTVAGHGLRFHQEVTVGDAGLVWTPDGKALVSQISEVLDSSKPGGFDILNTAVHFYDPGTGAVRTDAFPSAVTVLRVDGWALSGWTGNEDSLQYYLLSPKGDAISWIDQQGAAVRTVHLQTGGWRPSGSMNELTPMFSPSGRYVAIVGAVTTSVYDLQDQGRLLFRSTSGGAFGAWVGPDRYASYSEVSTQPGGSRTVTYSDHTPDGKVVRSEKFVLPQDPHGECATFPISFGPASAFPGAFQP